MEVKKKTPPLLPDFQPMQHQRNGALYSWARHKNMNIGTGLFWQVGTGKSMAGMMIVLACSGEDKQAIWITTSFLKVDTYRKLDQYFGEGVIKKCIITGIKKGVDISLDEWVFDYEGDSPSESKVIICNYELIRHEYKTAKGKRIRGFEWFEKFLNYDIIIGDESHRFKNPTSLTTKAVHALVDKSPEIVGFPMTGTPIATGVADVWSQVYICKIPYWPESFADYRNMYCQMGGFKNKVIIGILPHMREYYKEVMLKSVVSVLKHDVIHDLKKKVVYAKYFKLSSKIMEAYKKYKKDLVLEFAGEKATVNNKLTLMMHLQAFVSGFMIIERFEGEKKVNEFKHVHDEKFVFATELLQDVIEQEGPKTKIIIWMRYTETVKKFSEIMTKSGMEHDILIGESGNKKQSIIDGFRSNNKNVILINVAIMEGYDILEATYSMYFENDFSFLKKEQSGGRNHRKGQLKQVTELNVIAIDTIDEKIFASVTDKSEKSEKFLNYTKLENEVIEKTWKEEMSK